MGEAARAIQVNFGKPFPLFPLDGVVLLPHALLKLFIFEPRYRQMVQHALDACGQIAMAVFDGDEWKTEYRGSPPVRRVVCLGQILHHEKLPDGNYRLIVQGVCRARIREEQLPDADRLYRRALLEPIDNGRDDEEDLCSQRECLTGLLRTEALGELASVRAVLRELDGREVPTAALLEVITLSVLNDPRIQYRLLAEGNIMRRAQIIETELERLRGVVTCAHRQVDPDAPSGVNWN